jgi:single-stranded-DNA-specific exonuclease
MPTEPQWHLPPEVELPPAFVHAVQTQTRGVGGKFAAQLLWQRGIRDVEQLPGFLDPKQYRPTSPFAFGMEMQQAVQRLQEAHERGEKVAIWGDFDADGVTATSVLWEGLQPFFPQPQQLTYVIPNRLTESHGLSMLGIALLSAQGYQLILTCDTGSTNLAEIHYARELGLDVIVTDHHTLPSDRPPVIAIINPRSFPADHPLATLSGVAVAYKLLEALYLTLPEVTPKALDSVLDLVAIGLIADLVELKGDCRYLAQKGIEQLQRHTQGASNRPGVAKLLDLCKKTGDRPTDISFGLGPRINAISRIHGDARFCVELLTSADAKRCQKLALETELANTRRKALQKDVAQEVRARLAQMDLSTTPVIVLADPQWSVGVLGLVAGQIARDYSRPAILLTLDPVLGDDREADPTGKAEVPSDPQAIAPSSSILEARPKALARGSARSVNGIDLYQLMQTQAHLLHSMGGHPFAAGLSLPVENLPLFTEAINRQFRQQYGAAAIAPQITPDLTVTVAELGQGLFRELKLLEPCGMGNPVPKLLILNCWFDRVWHRNLKDLRGQKVSYIKTSFDLWDETVSTGFPGVWWEHYKDEVPQGRCDAIVELDFNAYDKRYEVRLVEVRPRQQPVQGEAAPPNAAPDWILDWRGLEAPPAQPSKPVLQVTRCPTAWTDLYPWFRRALREQAQLVIAYPPPTSDPPVVVWERLVGVAKYLSRTQKIATRTQLLEKIGVGDRPLQCGIRALQQVGFEITAADRGIRMRYTPPDPTSRQTELIELFFAAICEERFQQRYFYTVPITTIRAIADHYNL